MRRLYVQQFPTELGTYRYCTLREGVDKRPNEWDAEQFASLITRLAEQGMEFRMIYDDRLKQRFKSRTNIRDRVMC